MSTTTPTGRRPGPDAGMYGPGSLTWRVHADPLTGVASLRAVLLQALHPVAAAAVAADGRDVWQLVADADEYLAVTTFGSLLEAATAAARKRALLACARGRSDDAIFHGDAEDLLLWGHVCRVDSFLDVVPRGGLSLTHGESDAYVAEQVRAAALVGLDPADVPHDMAAVRDLLAGTVGHLRLTGTARSLLHAAGTGPKGVVAGLAFATLPAWAQEMYGESGVPDSLLLGDAAVTMVLRTLGSADR